MGSGVRPKRLQIPALLLAKGKSCDCWGLLRPCRSLRVEAWVRPGTRHCVGVKAILPVFVVAKCWAEREDD